MRKESGSNIVSRQARVVGGNKMCEGHSIGDSIAVVELQ
jgi:hypothetical protein